MAKATRIFLPGCVVQELGGIAAANRLVRRLLEREDEDRRRDCVERGDFVGAVTPVTEAEIRRAAAHPAWQRVFNRDQ